MTTETAFLAFWRDLNAALAARNASGVTVDRAGPFFRRGYLAETAAYEIAGR